MPRAKPGQRFGGRTKGSKNKATIQREIEAAAMAARAAGSQPAREPALEALERYKRHCEGVAAHLMPDQALETQPKHKDLSESGQWIDRAIYCARELAKYQAPQMRAIVVAPPPADTGTTRKRFTLTIFEGDRAIGEAEVLPPESKALALVRK